MKYLKLFEKLIRRNNPIVLDHPLLEFSERLKNVVLVLKEEDDRDDVSVSRNFDDADQITIHYKKTHDIFRIILKTRFEGVFMSVYYDDFVESKSELLFNFIKEKLSKYLFDQHWDCEKAYLFPIKKLGEIIDSIEEFKYYISSSKYNL